MRPHPRAGQAWEATLTCKDGSTERWTYLVLGEHDEVDGRLRLLDLEAGCLDDVDEPCLEDGLEGSSIAWVRLA